MICSKMAPVHQLFSENIVVYFLLLYPYVLRKAELFCTPWISLNYLISQQLCSSPKGSYFVVHCKLQRGPEHILLCLALIKPVKVCQPCAPEELICSVGKHWHEIKECANKTMLYMVANLALNANLNTCALDLTVPLGKSLQTACLGNVDGRENH